MPEDFKNGTIPDGQESPESGADQTQTTTTETTFTESETTPTTAASDNSGVKDTLGQSIRYFTDKNKELERALQEEREARLALEQQYSTQQTQVPEYEASSEDITDEYGNVWYKGQFRDPEFVAIQKDLDATKAQIEELRGLDSQREQAREQARIEAETRQAQEAFAKDLGQVLEVERAKAFPFLTTDEAPDVDEYIAQKAAVMAHADIDAGKELSKELVQGHILAAIARAKAIFGKAGNAQIEANLRSKGLPSNDGQVVLEGQKSYSDMTRAEQQEFNERRAAQLFANRQ